MGASDTNLAETFLECRQADGQLTPKRLVLSRGIVLHCTADSRENGIEDGASLAEANRITHTQFALDTLSAATLGSVANSASFVQGETMFTPQSLSIALLMMITSAVCWGSWANTYKGVKNYRFELFYWDYAVGIFLISLILALTMGSSEHDASSFLNNVHSADTSNIVNALIGGAFFNLANLLLVAAIDMAGLAVAFPGLDRNCAGRRGGVELRAATQGKRRIPGHRRRLRFYCGGPRRQSLRKPGICRTFHLQAKALITCVVSGVLMGLWAPFMTHAMTRGNYAGSVQRRRVPDLGSATFLLHLEYLLHETPARGRTGELQRIVQRSHLGSHTGPSRRMHLGRRHGFQSGCWEFHRSRHFLRHRPVGAHGRCALGNSGVEGI